MSIRLTRYAVSVALGAVMVASLALASSRPARLSAQGTLASFYASVNSYVATRAQTIRDVPPAPRGASFSEIAAAHERQFRAVQAARAGVKPGNVFNPRVAGMFRRTIAFTCDEYDIDVRGLLAELRREVPKGAARPQVNEQFPWVYGAAVPMVLLEALPSLPAELQYRLVGRGLVLLDIGLGLVVDILPNALPKD